MATNSDVQPLSVLLVDDDLARAEWVAKKLQGKGLRICSIVAEPLRVLKEISAYEPDLILIDMESPGRDMLESLSVVSEHHPTPIIMFSSEEDPDYIARAVDAGVSTYLVGSIEPAKVKPVIEAALAQFRSFQALRETLAQTRQELEERRTVDQAKTTLMKKLGLSEEEAYREMRTRAMNTGQRLHQIAADVVSTVERGRRK